MMSPRLFLSVIFSIAVLLLHAAAPKDEETFVVVIDAGHGGRDVGAVGAFTNEKSINLAVARELRERLGKEAPDFKVVMTRASDKFLPLATRARIANEAGGDLFVSIHTNSLDRKNPRRKSIAGASVYALGLGTGYSKENLEVAMRENGVITLEPDFTATYEGFDPSSAESYIIFEMDTDLHRDQSIRAAQAVQRRLVDTASRTDRGVRQAHFMVLRLTAMPAILVELDFICNPAQEKFMASEKGRGKLARAIADGIMEYGDAVMRDRARIAGKEAPTIRRKPANSDKPDKPEKPEKPEKSSPSALPDDDTAEVYRIQFLSSPKKLRDDDHRLQNIPLGPVCYYKHGGLVKYTVGRFSSQAEAQHALKQVRHTHSDAFIIRTQGSRRL